MKVRLEVFDRRVSSTDIEWILLDVFAVHGDGGDTKTMQLQ